MRRERRGSVTEPPGTVPRSEKNGCIMCQSSGCLAIVSAKKSATSCIIAISPSLPWRGAIGSPMMIAMPSSAELANGGQQGCSGAPGNYRRAGWHGDGMPSPGHRYAGSRQVPIRQQADDPSAMDRVDECGEGGRVAMGDHLAGRGFPGRRRRLRTRHRRAARRRSLPAFRSHMPRRLPDPSCRCAAGRRQRPVRRRPPGLPAR